MSASQRRKGAAGEREWCAFLAGIGIAGAKRLLGQARDGGGDVPVPPILWEVKRHAAFAVYKHLDQAKAALEQNPQCDTAAVAARGDNREWLVVLSADDFFRLMQRAQLGLLPPQRKE